MNNQERKPSINCLIVDANVGEAKRLHDELINIPAINILGIVSDPAGSILTLRQKGRIDMVFFGVGGQNTNTFALAVQVRTFVKCIIFIGEGPKETISAFQAGGDGFISKPLSYQVLNKTVTQLIKTKVYGTIRTSSKNALIAPFI